MAKGKPLLISGFLASSQAFADRPAIEVRGRTYTYSELSGYAGSFSSALSLVSGKSEFVGLLAERSITAYAGILGILHSGKAYMPLNPGFPPSRNGYILERSGADTLIVGTECMGSLHLLLESVKQPFHIILPAGTDIMQWQESWPLHAFSLAGVESEIESSAGKPEDPAYLLFTSGSTGWPKGVPVSNRNAAAYVDHITSIYDFLPGDRFSQTFDLTFDLSVHDLFVCWSAGACLCVPEENSSFFLAKYLKDSALTIWFSVPSVIALMMHMRLLKKGAFPALRLSFFCGEPLLEEQVRSWSAAAGGSLLVNLYGPTETTIAISRYDIPPDLSHLKALNGIVSIGRVFEGHRWMLLQEGGNEDRGELCLSGPQVVAGYLGDAAQTGSSFIRDEYWWYKTGDRVEADPEDELFFLGRTDSEVKVSGYRVNLLEIEHVINQDPSVEQAIAVIAPTATQGIAVFILPVRFVSPSLTGLMDRCKRTLPWYMVPEKIIFVEEIPLNPNGKTDKNSLIRKYFA